jgi:diguanylate cyclase (GGDEF)-like protein
VPAAAIAAASAAPAREQTRSRYAAYALGVGVGAVLALGAAMLAHEPRPWVGVGAFWMLAALCLLGEALPIRLARGASYDEITLSTTFAFAVLLAFGPLPAMVLFGAVTFIVDVTARRAAARVAFNAAQYVLSIAAGAGVLALAGGPGEVALAGGGELAAMVLAGLALFTANHVLAGTGAAILTARPIRPYLLGDLGFHAWAAGSQLALAPVLIACAQVDLRLIPLVFLPLVAIYLGGQQAVINQHRALHDELTDLPNRQLFGQRLSEAIAAAEASGERFVLMLADLDDFKAVNDSLGHDLGDLLLRAVGARLRAAMPADALVARLGGDEFALLVPLLGLADADALARNALEQLEQPIDVESFSLDVRASVGLAAFPEHGREAHLLLKHADVALYRAKETRTRVESYADERASSFDRLALAAELRRGIERGELVLHYQPKLALSDDQPHGVEALVRWQHPYLGLVSPEGFVPLAEQSNLIKPLTTWVLDAALGQCEAWRRRGLDLRVAVNLSTRSLLDRGLPGEVQQLLARRQLPPSVLQLEVTETKIVADFGRARDVLHRLRAVGIRVAIDDFGTGYSSLAQLQQLPADEIKIDKSFVMDMDENVNNAAIVRSTIGLGRNLGLAVTAEGVETPQTLDRLVELGCDYAQGYHLGRPATAEECERELRSHVARRRFVRGQAEDACPRGLVAGGAEA